MVEKPVDRIVEKTVNKTVLNPELMIKQKDQLNKIKDFLLRHLTLEPNRTVSYKIEMNEEGAIKDIVCLYNNKKINTDKLSDIQYKSFPALKSKNLLLTLYQK